MDFGLSEDQQLLEETVRSFLKKRGIPIPTKTERKKSKKASG